MHCVWCIAVFWGLSIKLWNASCNFFCSCWISSWQCIGRSETGQAISRTEWTHSVLWLGSYGQKGWYVVYTMVSKTGAGTKRILWKRLSADDFFGDASHLSRGNRRISHEVLLFGPDITVCISALSKGNVLRLPKDNLSLDWFLPFFMINYCSTAVELCGVDICTWY